MPPSTPSLWRLRPWMAWLGLALPLALTWWWVTREPRLRAEAEVADTLDAARTRGQKLEERFNTFRRLAADLAEEPLLAALLGENGASGAAAAARQLNLVAKASGGAIDRVQVFDSGGLLRLGWAYDATLDNYRPLPLKEVARLDLPYVQAALRAPRGATWAGASESEGLTELLTKPENPVTPSAHISVPIHGAEAAPRGVLVLKARLDAAEFLGPGNREPWMILGEQGDIIFRPVSAAAWVHHLPSAHRLQTFEEAFGRSPSDLTGESGALGFNEGLVCYRRVRLDHRRDWVLLRPFAKDTLFALGHETLIRVGILWTLSLLLLGLGAWALHRREQAGLREAQNQLLQATLNASRDLAIFATGPDGVIRLFSAGAERMLGFAADEAIGRFTMEDFHVPDELPEAAAAFNTSGEHTSQSFESVAIHRAGGRRTWTYRDVSDRHFPVFLSITGLRGRAGESLGHVVVAQDARPVLERERQLEEAAREAQEADRVKGAFLAVMSHEIRTPMNAIMGMVRVLKRTTLDPQQREITEVGERAARSLLEMLDGVLDYTKLEAGRMTLEATPFAPHALTLECAELWRLQATSKGLDFELRAQETIPIALGDPARLRQILNNLLGNAVKFTQHGKVSLSILAEHRGAELFLRWEIEDSGPGISVQDRDRIFEPFTQADDDTTRRHGGTGLGLALCRELASLMGGRLAHENLPTQGARFVFDVTLPKAESTEA